MATPFQGSTGTVISQPNNQLTFFSYHTSYLLITATHLYALREIHDRPGFARISVNRSLASIMKITSKKRHPEFITIKYGRMQDDETVIVDLDRYVYTVTYA